MSKKTFLAPSQMMILTSTGSVGGEGGPSDWHVNAGGNVNPDEEGTILFPNGETTAVGDGDVKVAPESSGTFAADSDEAYY